MRVLGWVLFAATCVVFALQGLFLAVSTFPLTSYEVLVVHVFPLLGIGAIVGAGVGALIVSRYPRSLIGWLFLVGQLGNVIGFAAEAFRVLIVQGVVDSPLAGQVAGYLSVVFGTTFAVSVMSVIFMIAPDGQLLSRRWRLAVAVPIAAVALRLTGSVTLPAGAYLPGAVVVPGFRETFALVCIIAGSSAMLLAISRRGGPGPADAAIHRPAAPPAPLDINGGRSFRGNLRAVRVQRAADPGDAVDLGGSYVLGLHLLFRERRGGDLPLSALRHRRHP